MRVFLLSWLFGFFISVLFVGSVTVYAQSEEGKWTLVGFTKYRDAIFINKNSISYPSHDMATAWARIEPSEKSKYYREIKKELKKSKKPTKRFKYTEILNEIDCAGNRIRYMKIVYFSKEDNVIHSSSRTEPEWKKIHPGSLWENMQKAVCNK